MPNMQRRSNKHMEAVEMGDLEMLTVHRGILHKGVQTDQGRGKVREAMY